jgi:solute carrier family 35 protein F5
MHIIQTALILSPLWCLANYFYNYGLYLTSIGSSTVISSISGVFTLFFSWKFGIEIVVLGKVVGLLLCVIGTFVVAIEDDIAYGIISLKGDYFALLGAFIYSMYTTFLGIKVRFTIKLFYFTNILYLLIFII